MLKEGEDLRVWKKLNRLAMSDVETDDEQGGETVHRTLPWRDMESTDLIRRIDVALRKIRKYGRPSEREPDETCHAFAREQSDDDDNDDDDEEEEENE